MKSVRVVLADDHVVLRVGLKSFLEEQSDPAIEVVGEASDGSEALELVRDLEPDLLILDLSMPGKGGLDVTIALRHNDNPVPILVLTQYAEAAHLRRLLEAGANGYILKTSRGEELLSALRAVLRGSTYIDPDLTGALIPNRGEAPPSSDEDALQRLTPRERQVLVLVAEGLSNKEVAQELNVSVKTAMAHRANLMSKLDIHNRSVLVQFAVRTGLITLD